MQTEPKPIITRGLVVSDLHLWARRSEGTELLASLAGQLAESDVLVMNGDTFDFRWIALCDREKAFAAAVKELHAVLQRYPQCEIHFLLGNHDCLLGFQRALTTLAARAPRFHWHAWQVRLGSALFLHGDCAEARIDALELQSRRDRWERGQRRGLLTSMAYGVADGLGLTRWAHECFFPRHQTVQRITHYLDRACPGWRLEIQDCYFGHTHLPFSNHQHEGVIFHNTGSSAAQRGMGFNPLVFEIPRCRNRGTASRAVPV